MPFGLLITVAVLLATVEFSIIVIKKKNTISEVVTLYCRRRKFHEQATFSEQSRMIEQGDIQKWPARRGLKRRLGAQARLYEYFVTRLA